MMVSIVDLPEQAIELVYDNINQHQMIALAHLHSSLYTPAKSKLYHYIYVYNILRNETEGWFRSPKDDVKCAFPEFRFPKHINNDSTNRSTIVSMQSFEIYLDQMDPNHPIDFLVFTSGPEQDFFEKVISHFKTIKHFIILAWGKARFVINLLNERTDNLMKGLARDLALDGKLNRTVFLERCNTYIGDTDLYLKESYGVHCFFGDGIFKSTHDPHREIKENEWVRPVNTRKLHILYDVRLYTYAQISSFFNTFILRKLFISQNSDADQIFDSLQLDDDFPNLILLAISYPNNLNRVIHQMITRATHKSLQYFTISTVISTAALVRRICDLPLQFPRASVNGWQVCNGARGVSCAFRIQQHYMFSPIMPPGCIGVHWPSCNSSIETVGQKYVLRRKRKGRGIEVKRCYNDTELRLMETLFLGKDYFSYKHLE